MAEPPRGSRSTGSAGDDEPEYHWLYGGKRSDAGADGSRSSAGSGPGAGAGHDPEPTRMLPTMGRPGSRGSGPYEQPAAPRAGGPG
ncbi:MAG: hypothetical protein WBQ50_19415, partial [Nocardioides sp.]